VKSFLIRNLAGSFRNWEGLFLDDLQDFYEITEKLKAIAHPHRLCIVKGLISNPCNVTKIQDKLNLPQSTISQHIAKLKAGGIIHGQRKGVEICYGVIDEDIKKVILALFPQQEV
jgi:ArsR family transcriptional regulator